MKRLSFIVLIIFSVFIIISCGDSGKDDTDNTDDTENTEDIDDTGSGSDDDTANTGSDDDNTGTGSECVGISVENIVLAEGYAAYEGTTSTGSEDYDDILSLQFYKADLSSQDALTVGTYDLATDSNANYSSCTECLLIYEDLTSDGSDWAKTFFQTEGTLDITEVKEGTLESKGTLTAKVAEVTINSSTYESTPVEGGACYEIQTSWDTICIPECGDRICGSDGCGGSCGDGCADDEQCSSDGLSCNKCTAITMDSVAVDEFSVDDAYWFYDVLFSPKVGDETVDDLLSFQFRAAPEADTYDLVDTNYSDCTQCIIVLEDYVEDISVNKVYFQEKGTVTVESFDGPTGNIKAAITGLQLREVEIGTGYVSTFVQDGSCLFLESASVDISE